MRPEQIVEQFDEPVRRWFVKRVTSEADATDLAQETMIAVVESLSRFRGDASIRTWVFAIARNQLLKYLRGVQLRPLPLQEIDVLPDRPQDDTQNDADRIAVQVAVSHLPAALRQLYRLFYVDGLDTGEIARRLRRSRGTVKYQLFEIRRRVRRALR